MLTPSHQKIRALRLSGQTAQAMRLADGPPVHTDEDAFEVLLCGFAGGNVELANQIGKRWKWQSPWAKHASEAVFGLMVRADREQAVQAAAKALAGNRAHPDVQAIYLNAMLAAGQVQQAYEFVCSAGTMPAVSESFLLTSMAEIASLVEDWKRTSIAASLALITNPRNHRTLLALSVAALGVGNRHEALGFAQRANALAPNSPLTLFQMIRSLNACGDYFGALAYCMRARNVSDSPHILDQAAQAYVALGKRELALDAYQESLRRGSRSVEAIRGLLRLHMGARHSTAINELASTYAAEISRDADALFALGLNALFHHDRERARQFFERSTLLALDPARDSTVISGAALDSRLRHEVEQLSLLDSRGKLDADGKLALQLLVRYATDSPPGSNEESAAGPESEAARLAMAQCHFRPQIRFSGVALARNDYPGFEARFEQAKPAIVVIDNFLTPEAIKLLRQFCEEANIFKTSYPGGYHGAFLSGGLCNDVLLAVADELRLAMPRVVGPHPLMQAWAFKYDQQLSGIATHADFSRVNLNFWITPQESCIDEATGGLVVYDLPAPQSWTFQDYNAEPEKVATLLKVQGARAMRIPYRENRCVLFDSTLFHATDECHFKPGYNNRRVNLTMLFGDGLVTV